MEIKTDFIDMYTKKIDKLLTHYQSQKLTIYGLIRSYRFQFLGLSSHSF